MPETMTPEQTFAAMVAEGDVVLDKLDECARAHPDKVFIHYGEDDIKLKELNGGYTAHFTDTVFRVNAGSVELFLVEGESTKRWDHASDDWV